VAILCFCFGHLSDVRCVQIYRRLPRSPGEGSGAPSPANPQRRASSLFSSPSGQSWDRHLERSGPEGMLATCRGHRPPRSCRCTRSWSRDQISAPP